MTDFQLGLLLASSLAMALTLLMVVSFAIWLIGKLSKFQKLWIEQDKGFRFGGEVRK